MGSSEMRELKKIINVEKKRSFSDDDIMKLCQGRANLITYPEVYQYGSLDQLMGKHGACIILYMTRKDYGHWVCIFKKSPTTVEFYDAYGFKPDSELLFASRHVREEEGQEEPYLCRLLYESGYKVDYNDKKLQKKDKDISTCGRWVGMRLLMRDVPLNSFSKMFSDGKDFSSDDKITLLSIIV